MRTSRPSARVATLALATSLLGCWDLRPAEDRRADVAPADAPQADEAATLDAPDAMDAPPDAAAEAALDVATEAAADAVPDAVPDATPDAAPDVAMEAMADAPPDVAPDAPPDVTVDAAPDAAPDVTRDASPDAAPDATPDAAPDAGAPTVPLPILPPSGGRVLRSLPTFEVDLPAGATSALIEVCSAPNCASPLRTLTLQRTAQRVRGRLTGAALADGRYWWRAHALAGAERVATSATWRFRLTARAGAVDAVGPDPLDVDGNGVNDFVAVCDGRAQLYLGNTYFSAANLGPTSVSLRGRLTATGDFNGDGYGDVAAIAADDRVLNVYLGRATGLASTPWTMSFAADDEVRWLGAAGDFNRDGYADLALDRVGAAVPRQVTVVYGGAAGLRLGPSLADLAPTTGPNATTHVGAAGVGDYDNDGYEDLAVGVPGPAGGEFERFARVFTNGRLGASDAVATYPYLGTPRSGGDMNGDGVFDIIARHATGAALVIGSPAGVTPFTTPAPPIVAAGDFTNDGVDDIFIGGRTAVGAGSFVGIFMGRTATGFVAGSSGIYSTERAADDLVDAAQWGLYDGDMNPDALMHLDETVGGVRRGALRIYRSGGGIIYSSPTALTLANCTNVIAW